jgi:hypothetical protein
VAAALDELPVTLGKVETAVGSVVEAYAALATVLGGPSVSVAALDQAVALGATLTAERAAINAQGLKNDAQSGLDVQVEQRIAYADGSLRQLRLLEMGFAHHWKYRRRWFLRRGAELAASLGTVLAPFAGVLLRARAGTAFPVTGATLVLAAGAVAVGARRLALVGEARSLGLENVAPGAALWLLGERPGLAVATGAEAMPDGSARLQVLGVRVALSPSTARQAIPGTPGIVSAAPTFALGGFQLGDAGLRRGRSATAPARDGLYEQALQLWSTLCLLQGTSAIEGVAGGAFPVPAPTSRWTDAELTVTDDVVRVLIDESDLGSGSWWDDADPTRSVFARPGELLLVRARDENGMWWQSVGETRRVAVMSRAKAESAPGTAPPDAPVCCGGPGEVTVIDVEGLRFPEALDPTTIRVGRDFGGFGVGSLAARELLPREIDPANTTVPTQSGQPVNRQPEFLYALRMLDRLLGLGP